MAYRRVERLVNLTIALLATRHYVTRDELRRAVSGYAELNDEAFERQFERDKDALRELGVPVETGSNDRLFADEVGYRIARTRFELPPIDLTADEATAVALAARAWQSAAMGEATQSALAKLRAAGFEPQTDRVAALAPGWSAEEVGDAASLVEQVWRAVRDRRRLTFTYRGQRRRLEPWVMTLRRGAWYVTGRDVDKGEERIYRLSRVEGGVAVAKQAGSYDVPEGVDARQVAHRLEPAAPQQVARVALSLSAPPALRSRARVTGETSPLPGFIVHEVDYADAHTFVTEICAAAPEAVVLDPPELVADAVAHLRTVVEGADDGRE